MSLENVRPYLEERGYADRIILFDRSSATVALAAEALGCEEARIAKTLAFAKGEHAIIVVAAGDARIYSGGFKHAFGIKPSFLDSEAAERITGHRPGGICPFALKDRECEVYLDISLKRFDIVYPAAGEANSAIPLSPDELFKLSQAISWVDVTRDWKRNN